MAKDCDNPEKVFRPEPKPVDLVSIRMGVPVVNDEFV